MVRTTDTIHTTLPRDLKKLAFVNDISWTEALKVGIDLMLKVNLTEEESIMTEMEELKKQIIDLQNKYKFLRKKLEKILEEKKKPKDPDLKRKQKLHDAVKMNNPLRFKK